MKRRIFQNLIIVSCLFFGQSKQAELVNVRGVAKKDLSKYQKTSDNKFHCLDGYGVIPYEYVNDDYCDCMDGSDEPGTSACSNGMFHCANEGHIPNIIQSSRVNDGVCDYDICCDGSDEYDGKINCPSRCIQLNVEITNKMKEEENNIKEGLLNKQIMIDEAKKQKINDEEEVNKISQIIEDMKKEKDEKEVEIKEYEKYERKNNNMYKNLYLRKKEEIKQIEKEYQKAIQDILLIKDKTNCDLSEIKKVFDKYNTTLIKMDEENENVKEEEVKKEDKENDGNNENTNKEEKEEEKKNIKDEESEEEKEERKRIEKIKKTLSGMRKKKGEINQGITKKENIKKELEEKLLKNHGKEDVFYTIHNKSYKYETNEYIYEIKWGDKITQKQKNGPQTTLGKFKEFSDDKQVMYDNGQSCWNGPKRSVKVILQCNSENEIISITEPNKCEYEMIFGTPASCTEESYNTSNDNIKIEHKHDEL